MTIPSLSQKLSQEQQTFLHAFSTSCRRSIIEMTSNAQSGHPGGSLSCIDYLSLVYSFIVSQTGEPVIISNGHISPAVYAVLAELGYISKKDVLHGFRKAGFPYEGHVSRHVRGVWYGTGPLGAGISAASGFAVAQQGQKQLGKKVFALIGDGESQEGQVYEMMNFAHKYHLNNMIVFMDYNHVQLSDTLETIMPIHPRKQWEAAGWKVIDVDGHNYQNMWRALRKAHAEKNKPVLLLGHTIMGKGVRVMEKAGKKKEATWHGKAPTQEQTQEALAELTLNQKQEALLAAYKKLIVWKPKQPAFPPLLSKTKITPGTPRVYEPDVLTDCRSAYGQALLDLAKKNPSIVALTADLAESVKTSYVKEALPNQHIECGIAEQHMVSCAGGLSLSGYTPFCSTFGAFMTSRAKDQARVNDINQTNVKMVATHCGLSVGEDGPTHQAIDDMGSMLGLLNTLIIEPADPNHTDRIIRYVATHYGNMYVRMGRHKLPVLTKEDGTPLFDKDYTYEYGRCDVLRKGDDITLAASGPMVAQALEAHNTLQKKGITAEIIIMSSAKCFDSALFDSIKKTKRIITIEDHNTRSGYGSQLARELQLQHIPTEFFLSMGVDQYQLSGTAQALYNAAHIDTDAIVTQVLSIIKK